MQTSAAPAEAVHVPLDVPELPLRAMPGQLALASAASCRATRAHSSATGAAAVCVLMTIVGAEGWRVRLVFPFVKKHLSWLDVSDPRKKKSLHGKHKVKKSSRSPKIVPGGRAREKGLSSGKEKREED